MPVEQFTEGDLHSKLVVVLQSWPLYRVLDYTGGDKRYYLPQRLELWCDNCRQDTFWQTIFNPGQSDRTGFNSRQYQCKNCEGRTVLYYFYWKCSATSCTFFKVGQYPELEERVSAALEGALQSDDLKMYKTALRLRNFNLGIASVAYMRRIVENRMNDILEVLYEAAKAHNAPAALLTRYEELKVEKRFTVKVDYAGDLLPSSLRPPGQPNPIAVLHELASDGLHTKTDDECVDIFDECRRTFEYVFGKMRIETEHAKEFVREMAKLAEKRAKAAE